MRPLAAALLVLALGPAAAAANAPKLAPVPVTATDLADAAGAVAPTAARGHVVFSRRTPAGRFELVDWSAEGGLRVLPVGDRAVPWDADAGPGARGEALVAFSRCTREGALTYVLPTVDWTRARGCRPWVLDLDRPGAAARPLRLAGAAGLSVTTPSIRGGSVAAVAAPPSGGAAPRVLLWATTRRAPVRLRGGTPPTCPYRTCMTAPLAGVDALDLGPRSVAFLWRLSQPGFGAGEGVELRASSRAPGRPGVRVPAAEGYVSGACGYRQPLGPTAGGGGGVAFLLAQSACTTSETATTLALQRAGGGEVLGARPEGALAYGAAWDDDRVYWLRGTLPPADPTEEEPGRGSIPCAAPGAACRLVVSKGLPLAQVSPRRPQGR